MADVKWIRITTDMFDNRKIKQIESLPDGDAIIVIWLKLLCLAGNVNDGGIIYFTREIPYTEQMISTQFGRPLSVVQMALKVFESFGMVEIVNEVIMISNWEKYQNEEGLEKIRQQNNARQKKFREKNKALALSVNSNVTDNVTSRYSNATNKEEDKELNNKEKNKKEIRHKYGEYQNVLLSDEDIEKLKDEIPNYESYIEALSSYMKSKGTSYKDHLATIRNWHRKDLAKAKEKKPKMEQRDINYDNLESLLINSNRNV